MKLFVTGHRPYYKSGGDQWAMDHMVAVAKQALEILKPDVVYTGMALGWDTAIALALSLIHI